MTHLCALILAAGKGTRMVSGRAKVLHEVCGEPMIRFVCRSAAGLKPENIFVVIGQDADRVRRALEGYPVSFVLQEPQLGTGHAVLSAREQLNRREGDVLVLTGDTPRIKTATLQQLVGHHRRSKAVTTLLTTKPPLPYGYGRILRATDGSVTEIVEEKDATSEQKKIAEINAAFYCFEIPSLLAALSRLSTENAQQEYYLTDVVAIQRRDGKKIEAMPHEDYEELQGINNRRELALASKRLWQEKSHVLMSAGVTIVDPDLTYVDPDVVVGKDSILHPQVRLEGRTEIGEGTIIRSGTRITDSAVGAGSEILDSCVISDSRIGAGAIVGPSAHLHSQTTIGADCRVGHFVEIEASTLGDRSEASHNAYIASAMIGANVRIGAGVITCDFDGVNHNATIIENDAFIGAGSRLVAPVRIRKGVCIAAGSCIAKDVSPGAPGIVRCGQISKTAPRSKQGRSGS